MVKWGKGIVWGGITIDGQNEFLMEKWPSSDTLRNHFWWPEITEKLVITWPSKLWFLRVAAPPIPGLRALPRGCWWTDPPVATSSSHLPQSDQHAKRYHLNKPRVMTHSSCWPSRVRVTVTILMVLAINSDSQQSLLSIVTYVHQSC